MARRASSACTLQSYQSGWQFDGVPRSDKRNRERTDFWVTGPKQNTEEKSKENHCHHSIIFTEFMAICTTTSAHQTSTKEIQPPKTLACENQKMALRWNSPVGGPGNAPKPDES